MNQIIKIESDIRKNYKAYARYAAGLIRTYSGKEKLILQGRDVVNELYLKLKTKKRKWLNTKNIRVQLLWNIKKLAAAMVRKELNRKRITSQPSGQKIKEKIDPWLILETNPHLKNAYCRFCNEIINSNNAELFFILHSVLKCQKLADIAAQLNIELKRVKQLKQYINLKMQQYIHDTAG
ncbi:MAG: hypothetical protein ACM3RX_04355 [Methanococcaceae archaeon]